MIMNFSPLTFLFAVVAVSVQGQDANFTGPGFLSCPFSDWRENDGCRGGFRPVDSGCPTRSSSSCDLSNRTERSFATLDETGETIYVTLFCECSVANTCPNSCKFSEGSRPAAPTVNPILNFTGVGTVTCPLADYYTAQSEFRQCGTAIVDGDPAACTECDFSPSKFQLTDGPIINITISLNCECIGFVGCPETCSFEEGVIRLPPTSPPAVGNPAPTPVRSPVGNNMTSAAASLILRGTGFLAILFGWMVM